MSISTKINTACSFKQLNEIASSSSAYVTCFGNRRIYSPNLSGSASLKQLAWKAQSLYKKTVYYPRGSLSDKEHREARKFNTSMRKLLVSSRQELDQKCFFTRFMARGWPFGYFLLPNFNAEPYVERVCRERCEQLAKGYTRKDFKRRFGDHEKFCIVDDPGWDGHLYIPQPSSIITLSQFAIGLPGKVRDFLSFDIARPLPSQITEILSSDRIVDLAEHLETAQVHLSRTGRRYITIEGCEGTLDLHEVTKKIIALMDDRDFRFTEMERKYGKKLAEKVSALVADSLMQVFEAPLITRIAANILRFIDIRRRYIALYWTDDQAWFNMEKSFEVYEAAEIVQRCPAVKDLSDLKRSEAKIGPPRYFIPQTTWRLTFKKKKPEPKQQNLVQVAG